MPTSVLVIDDSKESREQITNGLREAALFDAYRVAKDGLEGLKSLTENKPDIIICDLGMPRVDGFKFLQLVSAQPAFKEIPIIILTSSQDRESKIRGLEQGASDYLTKPFDVAELVARVKIHLKILKMQYELKSANEHLKKLSIMDPLTNLYNRRFLTEMLENELQRAKRTQGELALIYIDIDHFKEINDIYGHQMGDRVLVAVAEALHKGLRIYDIAARYGGEEFVLVLPGTPLSGALVVAERLRIAVESVQFERPMDTVAVTASMGVAVFPSERVDDFDSLFTRADEALYRAKQNGRNRVEYMN